MGFELLSWVRSPDYPNLYLTYIYLFSWICRRYFLSLDSAFIFTISAKCWFSCEIFIWLLKSSFGIIMSQAGWVPPIPCAGSWLGWLTASLMYSWPNFKARFHQEDHVIAWILNMHLKAWSTRCHLRQSSFKNTQQYFYYFKISIFSIFFFNFFYPRNAKHAIFKWS